MGAPVLVLVLAAVAMLVVGGFLAVSLPRALRRADAPVIPTMLGGVMVLGGACALLGLGGAIIAALVGAAAVAEWLGVAGFVGMGTAALSVLALVMLAVWRTVTGKQRTRLR
jgi:hypothetical protein